MKYKYSRKEILDKWLVLADARNDLLATIPEKEYCKFCLEKTPNHTYDCPKSVRNLKPSPSLDGLDIEEIDMTDFGFELLDDSYEMATKINQIIKKLKSL